MKLRHGRLLLGCSLLGALLTLFTGCETRSISDAGYHGSYGSGRNPFYRGELSEFDLLGLDRGSQATDAEIAQALDNPAHIKLRKGSTLLLIQSGAFQPDEAMRAALEKQFNVVPFTGQPGPTNGMSYSRAIRLAAAQAGCETIVCYWGALESARKDLATKSISWVPVVGWAIPDESQQMRICLKCALLDVRTGRWTIFSPPPFEDRTIMNKPGATSDQAQVEKLKRLAYTALAAELADKYSR
jgi:hypothetical protein